MKIKLADNKSITAMAGALSVGRMFLHASAANGSECVYIQGKVEDERIPEYYLENGLNKLMLVFNLTLSKFEFISNSAIVRVLEQEGELEVKLMKQNCGGY